MVCGGLASHRSFQEQTHRRHWLTYTSLPVKHIQCAKQDASKVVLLSSRHVSGKPAALLCCPHADSHPHACLAFILDCWEGLV